MQQAGTPLDIGEVARGASEFGAWLAERKLALKQESFWYPYSSLANFAIFDELLTGPNRDLRRLAGGRVIADVGGGDGDCSFYLERLGFDIQLFDFGPANFNGLEGARLAKEALSSSVQIVELNLDDRFELPESQYGLVLLLGLLYHLKNPFYALEAFSARSAYCLLSTKIARFAPGGTTRVAELPVAYLLDDLELNRDSTNFWIFSEAGLRRLFARTGWEVCEFSTYGDTEGSEPGSMDKDERAFCLLRSRRSELG